MFFSAQLKKLLRILSSNELFEKLFKLFQESFTTRYKEYKERLDQFSLQNPADFNYFVQSILSLAKAQALVHGSREFSTEILTQKDRENLYWELQYDEQLVNKFYQLIKTRQNEFDEIIQGEYQNALEDSQISEADLKTLIDWFFKTLEEDPDQVEPDLDKLIHQAALMFTKKFDFEIESPEEGEEDAIDFIIFVRDLLIDLRKEAYKKHPSGKLILDQQKAQEIIQYTVNLIKEGESIPPDLFKWGLEMLRKLFEEHQVPTSEIDLTLKHFTEN